MLHFDPYEIKTGAGHRAIHLDVGRADGPTDHLFTASQFLFDRLNIALPASAAWTAEPSPKLKAAAQQRDMMRPAWIFLRFFIIAYP